MIGNVRPTSPVRPLVAAAPAAPAGPVAEAGRAPAPARPIQAQGPKKVASAAVGTLVVGGTSAVTALLGYALMSWGNSAGPLVAAGWIAFAAAGAAVGLAGGERIGRWLEAAKITKEKVTGARVLGGAAGALIAGGSAAAAAAVLVGKLSAVAIPMPIVVVPVAIAVGAVGLLGGSELGQRVASWLAK